MIWYCGMMNSCGGTISTDSSTPKSTFRPGNRSRAKA